MADTIEANAKLSDVPVREIVSKITRHYRENDEKKDKKIRELKFEAIKKEVLSEDRQAKKRKKQSSRRRWNKGKKEFAQYVREQIKKYPNRYRDSKDATFKLYKQYKFQFRWTKLRCYEYVKQTPK